MTTFKKIRIITDSTCDLAPGDIERHHITVVPVFVNFGGSSYADDGKELDRQDYYKRLPELRPAPTTSAMPPALAEEALERVLAECDHVIMLALSSKLSGVYNAFRIAKEKAPADHVTLIDSTSTTMGLGWQVLAGAEAAEATGDLDATLAAMERMRNHSRVYAALSTLEYLHRSGRVGWAAAGIGSLLQIKPIISVEHGEVHSLARVRTFSRAVDELISYAHKHAPLDRLAILYNADRAGAEHMRERLKDIAPPDHTRLTMICPAIGTHIGPFGLGVVPVSSTWRQ